MQSSEKIKELSELTSIKEKEWKIALETHNQHLTSTLKTYITQLELEKTRFFKLKDDFEFNLNLLNERDKELKEYDLVFKKLKVDVISKNGEIQELSIRLNGCQQNYEKCSKEKENMKSFYEQKLKELLNDFHLGMKKKENLIRCKDNEIEDLRIEIEKTVSDMTKETSSREDKLILSHQETIKERDDLREKLKQQESLLQPLQMKLKLLENEVIVAHESYSNIEGNLAVNNETTSLLKNKLDEKVLQLEKMKRNSEEERNKLELKIKDLLQRGENSKKEFSKKEENLKKTLSQSEKKVSEISACFEKKQKFLKNQLHSKSQKLDECLLNLKQVTWERDFIKNNHEVENKSFKQTIDRLTVELECLKKSSSQFKVSNDIQIAQLYQSEGELKQKVSTLNERLESCKHDLREAIKSKQHLEHEKTQLDIEWRGRYEERECRLYREHEQLMRKQVEEKNQALTSLAKQKEDFLILEGELDSLRSKYEVLVKYLRKDDQQIPQVEKYVRKENDEYGNQNKVLKEVISQMREEIERLTENISAEESNNKHEYIEVLEKEVLQWKQVNRDLKSQLEEKSQDKQVLLLKENIKELQDDIEKIKEEKDTITEEKRKFENMINEKEAIIEHMNSLLLPVTSAPTTTKDVNHSQSKNKRNVSQVSEGKLREKLSLAVQQIKSLSKDRSSLIQLNNKLTADKNKFQQILEEVESTKDCREVACQSEITFEHVSCQTEVVTTEVKQFNSGMAKLVETPSTKFSSSGDSELLSEVWKILDEGDMLSSTINSKQSDEMTLKAKSKEIIEKPPKKKKNVSKIRNYNIKDD